MGEFTGIEWARGPHEIGSTWNPWRGCHKVSPACARCYMFRDQKRYGNDPNVVVRAKDPTFYAPLKWKEPRGIFTCSWSDWFIEEADEWRQEAWRVIQQSSQHTYLILTKRPERIRGNVPMRTTTYGSIAEARANMFDADRNRIVRKELAFQNVWLGVSVENARFYRRIDELQETSPALRFLSIEPLLGPMPDLPLDGIGWVIVGGESEPDAKKRRPINLDWVRQIQDRCVERGVPFFYKQGSGPRPGMHRELDGREWNEIPKL